MTLIREILVYISERQPTTFRLNQLFRADQHAPDLFATLTPGTRYMWIFGYGSLVWRPDFEHAESRAGLIEGYKRRFWQHSTDHRGVPGDPGRVATLIPEENATCWGVAYRIEGDRDHILRKLDIREQGGYERHRVQVYLDHNRTSSIDDVLVYIATRHNPNFAGPASLDAIARQIVQSEGPSGHNVEYLLQLADALRQISADDPHVFELEQRVRQLID